MKETIIQHFNYRWRHFVTEVNWLINQMSSFFFFSFWGLWNWNKFPGNVFLNSRSRHLRFVSGTWSGDSDLAFVHQSPGKEHPQSSAETDSVSQAISLNKSCWMNAFVPHSLPLIVSYCKGVTVNESSQCCHAVLTDVNLLTSSSSCCHIQSLCDFIARFYLSCSLCTSKWVMYKK